MAWLIETRDRPGSHDLRESLRPSHLDYLNSIEERLLACGAKLSDDGNKASGGIYLVDVASREAAERIINADPFTTGDLFEQVSISRWRVAYLDRRCRLSSTHSPQ